MTTNPVPTPWNSLSWQSQRLSRNDLDGHHFASRTNALASSFDAPRSHDSPSSFLIVNGSSRQQPRLIRIFMRQQRTGGMPYRVNRVDSRCRGRFAGGNGALWYRFNLFAPALEQCFKPLEAYEPDCANTDLSPCGGLEHGIFLTPSRAADWQNNPPGGGSPYNMAAPPPPEEMQYLPPQFRKPAPNARPAGQVAQFDGGGGGGGAKGVVKDSMPATDVAQISFQKDASKITLVAGNRAQSCSQACRGRGLHCDDGFMQHINNCQVIRSLFPCAQSQCDENEGDDQPAFDMDAGLCLIKRRAMFSCYGTHAKTRRFCACSNDASIANKYAWERALG
mmetsp:Transcript_57301/g.124536  ORF Transcript_57301/g.124536 Transcript_57301/m.124536 type:complete len:336 (+) Transcript_57301:57-1064(+)